MPYLSRSSGGCILITVRKNDAPVSFQCIIEIAVAGIDVPVSYHLQGILCHSGQGARSGHYYSYIKRGSQWFKCDDTDVSAVQFSTVSAEQRTVYVLAYTQRGGMDSATENCEYKLNSMELSDYDLDIDFNGSDDSADDAATGLHGDMEDSDDTDRHDRWKGMGMGSLPARISCWPHFNIREIDKYRQKYTVQMDEWNRIRHDLKALHLIPMDSHYVRGWLIIRKYWSSKGYKDLMEALHKVFANPTNDRGSFMAGRFGLGITAVNNPLECDNKEFRRDYQAALIKTEGSRFLIGKRRRKTSLLKFGRLLFNELYPMWSKRVFDEPFEEFAQPSSKQLALARAFSEEPDVFLVQVGQNMYATKQYGDDGDPYPITREEAERVITLWQTGCNTYKDWKLMKSVRLVTPDAALPDNDFATKLFSYRIFGLRMKLRATLPVLFRNTVGRKEQRATSRSGPAW